MGKRLAMGGLAAACSLASAVTDYFPNFYGNYSVVDWTCEANVKDPGCRDSARLKIESVGGFSRLTVFKANDLRLRSHDLIEKNERNATYRLGGDQNSATYTVEAFDGKGRRYFFNTFEMRQLSKGDWLFTQKQESAVAGFQQKILRQFVLQKEGAP